MKKLSLLIFSLTAFVTTGQEMEGFQDIRFGVKAGVNLATVAGDDVEETAGYISFLIGGTAEIPVSERFSIQPEILYSQQGFTQDGTVSVTDVNGTVTDNIALETTGRLDYLIIPIMAKYYVSEGFGLEAGPQIGFLLNSKFDVDAGSLTTGDFGSTTLNLFDNTKKFDFGVNLGAGYQLNSGLNFGLRYNLGLTDIFEASDAKNSVLQVSVGYTF